MLLCRRLVVRSAFKTTQQLLMMAACMTIDRVQGERFHSRSTADPSEEILVQSGAKG